MTNRTVKKEFDDVVSRDRDGRIVVNLASLTADESVIVRTDASVEVRGPTAEQDNASDVFVSSVDGKSYQIDDVLPDGWVVSGFSPSTGRVMSTEPVAGALDGWQTYRAGRGHCHELRANGHKNARQPTDCELTVLYNNHVKGDRNGNAQFDVLLSGIYWSSTTDHALNDGGGLMPAVPNCKFALHFSSGHLLGYSKNSPGISTRCVRDEPDLSLVVA